LKKASKKQVAAAKFATPGTLIEAACGTAGKHLMILNG
jgi:hypothetical protein